jgi:hypothetical protein
MHVHIIYLWLKFPLNLDPWVTSYVYDKNILVWTLGGYQTYV